MLGVLIAKGVYAVNVRLEAPYLVFKIFLF